MINLRFHIVSLVAVFLALAIGIAVGATVVDQGLVSQSQRRIASLDRTLEERAATISELRTERNALEQFGSESEARMVRDRLVPTSVLFVTDGPIDEERTALLAETLRASGARIVGTLGVGSSITLDGSDALNRARDAVGAASSRPDTVRFLVAERIITAIGRPSRTVELGGLVSAGLVARRASGTNVFPDVLPVGTRVVFLHAGDSTVDVEATAAFIGRLGMVAPVVVVGDGKDPLVQRVRDVAALAARVSTVDDLANRPGRVATVYALEDLARSRVGHYGSSEGAERLVPAP